MSPNRRLPHQPRLGCPASSLAVEEITGVGGGIVGTGGGGAPAMPIGAGSRMVERRRGGLRRCTRLRFGRGNRRLIVRPVNDRAFRRRLIERRRDGGGVLVADRREIRAHVLFRLRAAMLGLERRFAAVAALPVAASAAAAAPAPSADFAFGSHRSTALTRLLLVETGFRGRAGVVILVRDGMLGHRVAGELRGAVARFTRLAAAAASTPAPSTAAFALAVAARRFAAGVGLREIRRLDFFDDFALTLSLGSGLGLDIRLGTGRGVEHVFIRLDRRGHWRLRRRRQNLGGFHRVHLLAAIDDVGYLGVHRGVGGNGDGDAEALLQIA